MVLVLASLGWRAVLRALQHADEGLREAEQASAWAR